MKEYEEIHRCLAALAWCSHPKDISAAASHFKDSLATLGVKSCPTDPKDFIRSWGSCWQQTHSLKGKSSNSGRDRLCSDELIELVLKAITDWRKAGQDGPYASLAAVLRANPDLQAAIDDIGCSMETLRTNLKRYCPALVYKNLWVKQKLTDNHKWWRLRRAFCKMIDSCNDPTLLERVVWIDAKTMYCTVKSSRGWVLLGHEDILEPTIQHQRRTQ